MILAAFDAAEVLYAYAVSTVAENIPAMIATAQIAESTDLMVSFMLFSLIKIRFRLPEQPLSEANVIKFRDSSSVFPMIFANLQSNTGSWQEDGQSRQPSAHAWPSSDRLSRRLKSRV